MASETIQVSVLSCYSVLCIRGLYFIFVYMDVCLPACLYVHHVHTMPLESEVNIVFLESGIKVVALDLSWVLGIPSCIFC